MGKVHHQIRLRILSCNRMREKRREPEVPEEEVPVAECLDGHARISLKELAPIQSVKSGILQNARSTSPRVVADLGKSAHMRIARLMNSLALANKTTQQPYKVSTPCIDDHHFKEEELKSGEELSKVCSQNF